MHGLPTHVPAHRGWDAIIRSGHCHVSIIGRLPCEPSSEVHHIRCIAAHVCGTSLEAPRNAPALLPSAWSHGWLSLFLSSFLSFYSAYFTAIYHPAVSSSFTPAWLKVRLARLQRLLPACTLSHSSLSILPLTCWRHLRLTCHCTAERE